MNRPVSREERQEFYEARNKDIVVDFDGTLAQWAYPDMGEPMPGAKEALEYLRRQGYRIVINTCRMSPEINTIVERVNTRHAIRIWMLKNDMPYDEIDDGCNGKRLGAVYIDDQAVAFRGDWVLACKQAEVLIDVKRKRGEVHCEELLDRD